MLALRRWIMRTIRFRATRRGLLGGHPGWLAVFGLLTLSRQWNKVSKRGDGPVVFRERLEPGQSFAIVHLPEPPTPRQARKAAKKARKSGRA